MVNGDLLGVDETPPTISHGTPMGTGRCGLNAHLETAIIYSGWWFGT